MLIKPIFSVLAHAEKQFFSKLVFQYKVLYPVVHPNMETNSLPRKIFTQNGKKIELVETKNKENKIRDIFIQCLVFNKTIIPLMLVGYELHTLSTT